jgi:acyl carrier protein
MNETPLRAFLKSRFYKYDDNIASGANLSDIVDSLGLFELVEFVESEYQVKVPMTEFRPARFSSIREILTLVEELKKR